MRSIGFDLPAVAVEPPATDVARLLATLQEELDSRGTTSREVLAVAFDPEGEHMEVSLRRQPLRIGYPELAVVFGEIARTCAEDRIDVRQLRQIAFAEEAVCLQLVDGWGRPEVYLYPIYAPSVGT